jgi:LAS superfamily LD-carboxypeptidase LdcB
MRPLASHPHRRAAARLLAVALVAAAPALVPAAGGAQIPGPGPTEPGDGLTALPPVDPSTAALRSDATSVVGVLDSFEATVQTEVAQLAQARANQAAADAAVAVADAAVADTKGRIAALTEQSDQVVVDAFVNPPSASLLDALTAESTVEATVKQSILDRQSDAAADVLGQLDAAKAQLATEQDTRAEAASSARRQAREAQAEVDDVIAAQSQESLFVVTVQDRVAANLAEADAVERLDPAAAEALRARATEIANKLNEIVAQRQQRAAEAALAQALADAQAKADAEAQAARDRAAARPSGRTVAGASAGLSTVSCPAGGSITVASSIAGDLADLLSAADADGITMCGGGYRDPAEQIAVRRANCGTSYYAIYEAPASSCSPPTAPPGTSQHETGLAVDFTVGGSTITQGSAAFRWLQANAASYGLYNLPAEAWHWSTSGT